MPLWTLDSCSTNAIDNCQIEIDNGFNFIRFVRKCPIHAGLSDDVAGFNVLWNPSNTGENQRGPSNTLAEILDKGPSTLYDTATDGTRTFKRGITVSWAWSGTAPDRVLTVTVTGITLTTNQRNSITTFLNNRFGVGKVVLA
jgi:hypothetical protein